MRIAAFAGGVFCLMAAGPAAQPVTNAWPPDARNNGEFHLPQSDIFSYRDRSSTPDDNLDFQALNPPQTPIVPTSQPVLSLGALRLHLGSDDTRAHFAHYDFEDRRFLGGNITGTFDGKGATIRLRWPTHD